MVTAIKISHVGHVGCVLSPSFNSEFGAASGIHGKCWTEDQEVACFTRFGASGSDRFTGVPEASPSHTMCMRTPTLVKV